jgi:stage II sporulation protein D
MKGVRGCLLTRMFRKFIYIQFLLIFLPRPVPGQVRIRIFADQKPSSAVFSVIRGEYELDVYDGKSLSMSGDETVILAMYNGKIAVKPGNSKSFMCDSLILKGLTGDDKFLFRINGGSQIRQNYGGDLQCLSDLGVLVFINTSDIEQYIAGVVRTEGGPGKNIEFLKSQAVLARTYMYEHFERHIIDRYNLCDNTHCQAFNGVTDDSLIIRAALETKGLVILDRDSTLVISAFHSNCGGETSISEDVWLSGHSYFRKVIDPYCISSRNATWKKSIPVSEWETYLKKSGFVTGETPKSYNFSQVTRQADYKIASFSLPFRQIRNDLDLRSSFFSVLREGDSITFKGRGYGHGVGLCQEGAMVMAAKGFNFRDIIGFYYYGVVITDINNARIIENNF